PLYTHSGSYAEMLQANCGSISRLIFGERKLAMHEHDGELVIYSACGDPASVTVSGASRKDTSLTVMAKTD
ncbi:hypothetical protein, partial [Bradyrhizobium sp. Leo170]|uniref:hypothetical protein n=2 Tax=unclassified Bradyrhizobium TaxID=2631580 RepID=UPI0013EECEE0